MVSSLVQEQTPEGYQQTEVGVIPLDWSVENIGAVLSIRHGRDQKQVQCDDGLYPILGTGGEMGRTNDFLYDKPSVLIGRKGTINKPKYIDSPFWTVDTLFYSELNRNHSAKFIYYKFCMINWLSFNEASGVPSLNASTIESVQLSVPVDIQEQTAIANALSDVDTLITSLEKLIAKKRAIKTAAMQQLLTGKKRLPGFDDDWSTICMGKNANLKARIGWQALTTSEYLNQGNFYLVTGTDFKGGRVRWSTCHYVDEWRYNQDRNIQLKNGDVLLTKDGTIGKVGYVDRLDRPATLNSGVFVIRPVKNAFAPRFLFYVLSSRIFDKFLNRITAGSTITHLYQKDFVTFAFEAPSLDEQEKIADVFSSMDDELEKLEESLIKNQQLKQGMMQELLTGRTRLV